MKRKKFLKRLVSVLVIAVMLTMNTAFVFASEPTTEEAGRETQNIERSTNGYFNEFNGYIHESNANVFEFTAPATGTYSIVIVTAHISGKTQKYTYSLSENHGYLTSSVIENNRFTERRTLVAGRTYTIGLFGTTADSYYAYSGTVQQF